MQAVGPSPRHLPLAARIYGIRLLYLPTGRRRVALAFAVVAVLDYVKEAIGFIAGIDHRHLDFDFGQFQRAAQDLSDGRNPYDFFIRNHCPNWCLGGYIYTPLFAELIRPLAHLPLPRAVTIWLLLTHLMVLAVALVLGRALRGTTTTTALLTMLGAGLLFQPLFENLSYVQIGTLLLLVLAAAAALHQRGGAVRNALAGTLVGLGAVIKVTPLLVLPALLPIGWAGGPDRGQRLREGLAGIAGLVFAVGVLVAVMLLFVPHTADFFTQVLPQIGGGTSAYENKSFPALVARVGDWVGLLSTGRTGPALNSKLVTFTGLLVFVSPVAWLTARRSPARGHDRAARAAAFGAYVAAMPIVSTITWRHHLVVNILAMALLLPALWPLVGPPASRAARWLLAASYLLTYIPQDAAHEFAWGPSGHVDPTLLNALRVLLIEDLNLIGMVCLWVACVLALRGLLEPGHSSQRTPAAALAPATEGA